MPDNPQHTLHEALFQDSECLTRQQVLNYLEDRLTPKEQHEIEKHLLECPLCSDAVEGAETHPDDYKALLEETDHLIGDSYSQKKTILFNRAPLFAAAAVVLIGLFGVLKYTQKPLNQVIYQKYFEPYPNTIPLIRSYQKTSPLLQGLQFYSLNDYHNALPLLLKASESDNDSLTGSFYAGLSAQALDRFEEAMPLLRKVSNNPASPYTQPAKWYLGLIRLRQENLDEAVQIFSELSQEKGIYQSDSKRILKEIKSK